ncbi:MAG: UPF0280 family protein [bacterium]|nr:MAG: UPF0280 family protein [bacterium]
MTSGFSERVYREEAVPEGLVSFRVTVEQTDLWIAAERDLTRKAHDSVTRHRRELEAFIEDHPEFLHSLKPIRPDTAVPVRGIVKGMLEAGRKAGVGPMAAVAGAISEAVARDLAAHSGTVIVENGGDLYLLGSERRTIGIWAGRSPLSGRIGVRVEPGGGLAVCTSSGTVGPSLSLGEADAATVISGSGALADAAATELGNLLRTSEDIEHALDRITSIDGVLGALAVIGDTVGAKGDIELVSLQDSSSMSAKY